MARSKIKEIQQKLNAENDRIEAGIPILVAEKTVSLKSDKNLHLQTNREKYNLKPDKWTLKPVKKEVYKDVTYLSVQCITNETGDVLGRYIKECINQKQKFFVLDLRDVFGGTYEGAKNIAKWFVPNTSLGTLKTKKGKISLEIPKNKVLWQGGLVILVNKGTSKYGELLANAISQHKTAVVIGEETQGDFKDISVYDFSNGGGFTLTTGQYIPFNNVKKVVPKIKSNVGLNGKEIDKKLINKAMIEVGL